MTKQREKADKERKPSESSNFLNTFVKYANSIAALREFFSFLCPVVTKMGEEIGEKKEARLKEIIEDFRRKATKEENQEIQNLLELFSLASSEKPSKARPKSVTIKSPLSKECMREVLTITWEYTQTDIHQELLNRSILLSLVSYFEVLVADLAHAYYRIAPDAISSKDKVLSVNELKQFTSINEALHSVVAHRVDELLWGAVNDWQDFFESRMKINMKRLVPDWAQWNEYFQRRHIILHAGCCMTERYLSNVDWEKLEPNSKRPPAGHKLDVGNAYLEKAIDIFEIVGLLLCQEVWRKLVPKDTTRYYNPITETGLLDAVYRRLLSRHWHAAEQLATWGEQDKEAPEDIMLTCKFNRWLCIKRQGRWTEVEKEVKTFDCSAKNRKYAIVRASLLEQADEFFELLPAALGTDIPLKALSAWPILDEMRTDSRFAKALEEAKQREAKQEKGKQESG